MSNITLNELVETKEILKIMDEMSHAYAKVKANQIISEQFPRIEQAADESKEAFADRLALYKQERTAAFHKVFPDMRDIYLKKVNRLQEVFLKAIGREI